MHDESKGEGKERDNIPVFAREPYMPVSEWIAIRYA
jgi:hypothetical protein